MNVALPFDKDAGYSFWIVVGASIAAVAALWAFFRVKGIL
jgi:Mg2+ and Co2+ transporter CorA